jgi:hypothetical protein
MVVLHFEVVAVIVFGSAAVTVVRGIDIHTVVEHVNGWVSHIIRG